VIARPDGTYFRFSTGGNIAVHTAPDISGPWTYKGSAITGGSVIKLPGNSDLWVRFCSTFMTSAKKYNTPR
jgi:arabinan endo-1,5-alpha-L-arabinosidase